MLVESTRPFPRPDRKKKESQIKKSQMSVFPNLGRRRKMWGIGSPKAIRVLSPVLQ